MQRLNCGCSSGCDGKVFDFAVLGNVNVMGLHYSEIDSISGVSPFARLAGFYIRRKSVRTVGCGRYSFGREFL